MKLSKSILSAVALGLTISSTSCSITDLKDVHYDYCSEDCVTDHPELESSDRADIFIGDVGYDCPGCGMG